MTQARLPSISIVVPSFNQAPYIAETLQSLLDQQYPALQIIVQDGGSTDGAVQIAADYARRFPDIVQLATEKDRGQADAINRGFSKASGEILGFLNSDDTLYPGCLQRVATEIDPARGRHIVFGRCLFTGEGSPYVGVEHPAFYEGHFAQLAIWKRKFNSIPQPSVFWHRSVWEKLGGMDESENHALDYDLFCRFSRHYRFHKVDALWSTYRMHAASKSAQKTESEVLELSIATSRKHWGPWWRPLRWRCASSLLLYRLAAHDRGRHHARAWSEAARNNRSLAALGHFFSTAFWSPRTVWNSIIQPWLARRTLGIAQRLFWTHSEFAGQHGDGWIGPVFRHEFIVPADAKRIIFVLQHQPQGRGHHPTIHPAIHIDGRKVESKELHEPCQFFMAADISHLRKKSARIELRTPEFFLPSVVHGTPDERKLSVILHEMKVETE
ncbi:hypothetical protein ASA1KI_45480 [Opitutales bacterium ASA1]|uniref:glycosyltransferase family 2 protein n=1 Tax=Congregicoccus parvus TaxID=3081749 RepID=UPI002B2C0A3F|nr:hypothetical protein ASA1KI_45480 [Opitutales bacterium ASA1]